MKLFGRSGGYWLFWTGFVYFWLGIFNLFVYNMVKLEYLQAAWILILSLPLFIKPLAKWLNMKTLWEN